jgi:hypothetical protein
MTTRSTNKSAKPAAKTATTSRKPLPAKLPGERVIRYDLFGACDIALIPGSQAAIGKKAADALVAALRGVYTKCTVQCEGYVFNLSLIPLLVPEPDPQTKARKTGT